MELVIVLGILIVLGSILRMLGFILHKMDQVTEIYVRFGHNEPQKLEEIRQIAPRE